MNLKQRLRKKLKKNGGFTLIEMLIVVAIIAILVVVSIPMVSSSLDKAKTATDDANERAAQGAALVAYLSGEYLDNGTTATTYYYDAATGAVLTTKNTITGYNQTERDSQPEGEGCVEVKINESTGGTTTTWVKAGP